MTGKHGHHHHHSHHDHSHEHSHAHSHGHAHAPAEFGRAFLFGIVLNTAYVITEAGFGFLTDSLALLADAGHNLSDVLGLALAWGATVLSKRAPTQRFTYGLRSTTILAALTNAVVLLVATGAIAWEAVLRFRNPTPIEGGTMTAVAVVGVLINGATALLFMSGRKGDINVRGAFLHMVADAGITLGVVVAGILISRTGWNWLDPCTSLVIAVLVIWGTWSLMQESIRLALHAVPAGIDLDEVRACLKSVEGVTEVHDLHVWAMSTTETALTAHLVMPDGYPGDAARCAVEEVLHERFAISHPTIQIELGDHEETCKLAPEDRV